MSKRKNALLAKHLAIAESIRVRERMKKRYICSLYDPLALVVDPVLRAIRYRQLQEANRLIEEWTQMQQTLLHNIAQL